MSDFKKNSSTYFEKFVKNKLIHGRAWSQKCSANSMSCNAKFVISHFLMQILLE
jgi:hypothetical protein